MVEEGTLPPPTLPYVNSRLVLLQEELDDDSYFMGSTVVRLFHSPNSHPAVRTTLRGLEYRRVSLGALAVQALVNKRGPDGVVGVIPGEQKHSARLLALCEQCTAHGEVLACSMPSADMVLVPRLPATAAQDGLYFLAYATNLRAVELCERLRQQKQVAVVLDLDNTLVDAVSCTVAPGDWDLLDWRHVAVTNSYGRQMAAQYAPLPGHDPFAEEVWVMHWKVGRVSCTFKVRLRRGWADLREFLAQNADRFAVFVCSKGKREYIQLLWLMLDPLGQLIPPADWDSRLTSTFPDTLTQAANKTALTALGCYDITKPHVPTQLAVPLICLDDSIEAYEPEYEHSVMYVEEFRPSDLLAADDGNVLRGAAAKLEAFWGATCASDGTFAWQAAQSFAVALMSAMQRNPMGSPDDLSYLQVRCAKQGEALAHQFTVRGVFGAHGVFIADRSAHQELLEEGGGQQLPGCLPGTPGGPRCAACQLPECKPGCPSGGASASGGVAVPRGGRATLADDGTLSEGRSSEDSVLLGLPSPKDSVLPGLAAEPAACPAAPPPLPRLSAESSATDLFSGGNSPTAAEPRAKLQRLGTWHLAPAAHTAAQDAGAGQPPALPSPDGMEDSAALREHPGAQPEAAAEEPAAAMGSRASSSALAAALASISRGLLEDGLL